MKSFAHRPFWGASLALWSWLLSNRHVTVFGWSLRGTLTRRRRVPQGFRNHRVLRYLVMNFPVQNPAGMSRYQCPGTPKLGKGIAEGDGAVTSPTSTGTLQNVHTNDFSIRQRLHADKTQVTATAYAKSASQDATRNHELTLINARNHAPS